jgi:hypothetical protein
MAEIDGISNLQTLESLFGSVFDASSAEPVRAAIRQTELNRLALQRNFEVDLSERKLDIERLDANR